MGDKGRKGYHYNKINQEESSYCYLKEHSFRVLLLCYPIWLLPTSSSPTNFSLCHLPLFIQCLAICHSFIPYIQSLLESSSSSSSSPSECWVYHETHFYRQIYRRCLPLHTFAPGNFQEQEGFVLHTALNTFCNFSTRLKHISTYNLSKQSSTPHTSFRVFLFQEDML